MEFYKKIPDEHLIEIYLQAIETSKKVEVDPAFIDLLYAEVCIRQLDEKKLLYDFNAVPIGSQMGD